MFNGVPAPLGSGDRWHSGYAIYLDYGKTFSIFRYDNGVPYTLVTWTSSSAITTGWNTVKVTYNSSTGYLQAFINGTKVATGTLNTYKSGQVGLITYIASGETLTFSVDYAKLSLTAPVVLSAADSSGPASDGSITFDEATAPAAPASDINH